MPSNTSMACYTKMAGGHAHLPVAACRVKGESSGGAVAAKYTPMPSVTAVGADLSWHTQLISN